MIKSVIINALQRFLRSVEDLVGGIWPRVWGTSTEKILGFLLSLNVTSFWIIIISVYKKNENVHPWSSLSDCIQSQQPSQIRYASLSWEAKPGAIKVCKAISPLLRFKIQDVYSFWFYKSRCVKFFGWVKIVKRSQCKERKQERDHNKGHGMRTGECIYPSRWYHNTQQQRMTIHRCRSDVVIVQTLTPADRHLLFWDPKKKLLLRLTHHMYDVHKQQVQSFQI